MGGLFSNARAENELNNVINAGISVVNKSVQDCLPKLSNTNNIQFKATNGGVIDIGTIDVNQIVTVDTNCVANNAASTQLSQDIQNQMAQTAAATVGALSLGSTDANNYINSVTNLSQQISNSFLQKCSPTANNTANFQVAADGTGSQFKLGFYNLNQAISGVTQCMQTTVADSQAAEDLKQSIDQSATAKNEGLLDFLGIILAVLAVIAVIVIIVIIVLVIPKGGGGSKTTVSVEGASKNK
ncbi:MAG: hypothetical protein Solumvirus1_63 [Solumvirus sp.]|uniref:Uncharacterized protein n=1 Tax=Solumvirus sp. TaxID=2487773 RepID=A0A3G5AGD2_9VIRU|nr:MAG: hypothetical protein Solumvirus1_63 [Solumvirus sp.]